MRNKMLEWVLIAAITVLGALVLIPEIQKHKLRGKQPRDITIPVSWVYFPAAMTNHGSMATNTNYTATTNADGSVIYRRISYE